MLADVHGNFARHTYPFMLEHVLVDTIRSGRYYTQSILHYSV